MAEAAGLAIGGIGLAALATTCIDCMDYVTLERNHGKDFEIALAQMALLNCRLNVWGEVLKVNNVGRELPALREKWPAVSEAVGKGLVSIKGAFTDLASLESRYGLRQLPNASAMVLHESRALTEIEDTFHITQRRRQKETSLVKKTWWAVHDKKKFDNLLAVVSANIDSLEKLGEQLNILEKQKTKLKANIEDISDADTLQLLDQAQQASRDASASQSSGHSFLNTVIKDQAKLIQGNIDTQGGARHSFKDTHISGQASVVQGDMSGAAATAFWGSSNPSQPPF